MANLYSVQVQCYLGSTSSSTVTIGLGNKLFAIDAGTPLPMLDMYVRVERVANSARFMEGWVVAVDPVARNVTVNVTSRSGSTAFSDWVFRTCTLSFSNAAYVSAATDTPANAPHIARVLQPGAVSYSMFSRGNIGGRSSIEGGEIVLVNDDNALDDMLDYGFDGRPITVRWKQLDTPGLFYALSSWTVLFTGTAAKPVAGKSTITLPLRTRQYDLDIPIQTNLFAGTNSLPSGREGTTDDLQDKPKPLIWGQVRNISPPLVNTSRLIYQLSSLAVDDVGAVYDAGVSLTKGSAYTSISDMETNAPTAGQFRYLLNGAGGETSGGSFIRLGSSPAGQITADVSQGTLATGVNQRTVGQIVSAIVARVAPQVTVLSSDITDLDTANSAVVGVYIDSERQASDVLDDLCNSVGAWWGFDRTGQFRVKQLTAPTGTPDWGFRRAGAQYDAIGTDESEIISAELATVQDQGGGIPVWKVIAYFQRNWTVQRSGLSGSVSDARRAVIAEDYRRSVATDSTVKTKHLLSDTLETVTLLDQRTDAATEAARVLGLRSVRRDRLLITASMDAYAGTLDLGDEVAVYMDRWGCAIGKAFRIIGIRLDVLSATVTFELWG